MKKLRKLAALAAALLLALTLSVAAFGETLAYSAIAASIAAAEKNQMGIDEDAPLLTEEKLPAGSSVSDWTALAMARAGIADDYAGYLSRLQDYVERKYQVEGGLHTAKATEYHRIALTVAALNGHPTAFGTKPDGTPIDLIADGTYNWQGESGLGAQGLNGWIFALLTVDAVGAEIPAGARYSRQDMIGAITAEQLSDGGFSLGGGSMDVDITAMALQALAPYQEEIPDVIDGALNALSEAQSPDGGFESWGAQNSESCAQVILALCELGIDPESDERFQKAEGNAVTALLSFCTADGGVAHQRGGQADAMAGEQAMQALMALHLLQQGEGRFFDLRFAHPVQLNGAGDAAPAETPAKCGTSFPVLPVVLAVIAAAAVVAVVVLKKKREKKA